MYGIANNDIFLQYIITSHRSCCRYREPFFGIILLSVRSCHSKLHIVAAFAGIDSRSIRCRSSFYHCTRHFPQICAARSRILAEETDSVATCYRFTAQREFCCRGSICSYAYGNRALGSISIYIGYSKFYFLVTRSCEHNRRSIYVVSFSFYHPSATYCVRSTLILELNNLSYDYIWRFHDTCSKRRGTTETCLRNFFHFRGISTRFNERSVMSSDAIAQFHFAIFLNSVHLVICSQGIILSWVEQRIIIRACQLSTCACFFPNAHFVDLSIERAAATWVRTEFKCAEPTDTAVTCCLMCDFQRTILVQIHRTSVNYNGKVGPRIVFQGSRSSSAAVSCIPSERPFTGWRCVHQEWAPIRTNLLIPVLKTGRFDTEFDCSLRKLFIENIRYGETTVFKDTYNIIYGIIATNRHNSWRTFLGNDFTSVYIINSLDSKWFSCHRINGIFGIFCFA